MQGRPAGHQIDPLAIIVGLEEQVNESAQRIDNALKNLVDLAKAVRSLVDKVEQLQTRVEERSVMPEVVYGPDGEIHSETIAAIQVEHSSLLQRIDDLEKRQMPAQRDYAPEFQRAEADIEALRIQLTTAVKRQQEQENALREFEQLAPKLNQKLTDVARKYPEGSLAKVEDIERIGAAIAKIHKEQSKVEDRFKEFTQLKESSALLTILKTEHSALLRRLEDLELRGPVSGDGSGPAAALFDDIRDKLERFSSEHAQLKSQLAELSDQQPEAVDVGPQIEAAIAPLRNQVNQLASGPQIQSEVTRQIEAAMTPLRSRLDQLASATPVVPDLAPVVESAVAPLRQQLAALEAREPVQAPDTGKTLEKLEATLSGLAKDQDTLLDQLAEQSKLLELQKSEIGTLHDAFDGVKKAASGSGKPSPELIEAAAAAKHLQGVVENLSKEHSQLTDQLKGVKALEAKVAELDQRAVPDNSAELASLRETVSTLQQQQSASTELLAKLQALEIPQPVDYSQDFTNLRNEIGALNALQQPLLERIAELETREQPEAVDYSKDLAELSSGLAELRQQKAALAEALSGDLAGVVESLAELKGQKAALAEALAKVESREIPEAVDYSGEIGDLRATIEVLNEQQQPLLQRIAELEGRTMPEPVDLSGDVQALRDSLAEMQAQQAQLFETLRSVESREMPAPMDYTGEFESLRATIEVLNEQQAPLVQRLAELEARPVSSGTDNGADVARIQSAVDELRQQTEQVGEKLANYAEQQQITKLMETLSELQMRLGRTSDQLLELEQSRNQVTEEQRKQLQNQLDIQERQRMLLEELQVKLEIQQEQIEAQQKELAEFVEQARQAAEKKRRASDEPHKDPTMGPLIESALHIERGEYAEAVRCLEAARQLGENPKLDQALALARRMLEQQTK